MGVVTRLTKKHQTTIPREGREVLDFRAVDALEFVVDDGLVAVVIASPKVTDEVAFYLTQAHTVLDWDTPEDDAAFADL